MPIRKQELVNNEIYHVITRGVGDLVIFKDTADYYRAVFSLYEFNNAEPVVIQKQRELRKRKNLSRVPDSTFFKRDKLIEILSFCLMPNHIHLLVRQLKAGGISRFMGKFGSGYVGYFNRKHQRRGHLFQERFRSVHIENDNQFKVIFVYIHANPLSLIVPKWKEVGIRDLQAAIEFLENYKWSSYADYIGKKNFPSVTNRKFLLEVLEGKENCKEFVQNWLAYKNEISNFGDLILE